MSDRCMRAQAKPPWARVSDTSICHKMAGALENTCREAAHKNMRINADFEPVQENQDEPPNENDTTQKKT